MTWKEFKDKVESYGVKDDSEIRHIDVSTDLFPGSFGAYQYVTGDWSID